MFDFAAFLAKFASGANHANLRTANLRTTEIALPMRQTDIALRRRRLS